MALKILAVNKKYPTFKFLCEKIRERVMKNHCLNEVSL